MRQASLFAALRGRDGNSLAWALVALVLLGVFAGGLNAGMAAAGDTALCLVDEAGGKGPPPVHQHTADCCILGASPFGAGVAPAPSTSVPPRDLPAASVAWAELEDAAPGRPAGGATARGPPLKA